MNVRNKVSDLQSKLSHAAKQSLDRKFGALYEYSLSGSTAINRGAQGESTTIYLFDWDYTSSVDGCTLTTTVADKFMGKVVGEPYRGKLDVRFDEGAKGMKIESLLHRGSTLLVDI